LADKAISGIEVNREIIAEQVERNPILVTALNPIIGYQKAAEIAKIAFQDGRPVIDVAEENTDIAREELEELLSPNNMT
jgi:fumarate hydratase class II